MIPDLNAHFEAARDVQARRFHEEIVLLDLSRGEYFSLDEVGAIVWDGLGAGKSLGDIVADLSLSYDVDVAQLQADVAAFALELIQRHLVVETVK
jgi:Coenzyme PQQ synthesis protein D (PqqD)